ncbi:pantoate--beta-alanine ligase [Parvibaculum sp.]|uniref:pantoate--beta-alanine ligase n=1 Tax=Parvibaculum sp. TaxID=2024848 RepID=UPI000C51648C|nr:pantoate--beta-alanine ligase [Parvibaculum sp.]MAM93889.1 pantoate--beta-alanine ligase [Parvibaculum sp.]HCX68249.1 pantoate--beta-alanine ligase [Rhodobiaceae bacterium]|tara:strand:+ start:10880 stop:11746 length:867 start_codon:yes stop_codon:yes gene_type:complete
MPLDTKSYEIPVARSAADLREAVAAWRAEGLSVALVPTMGALHEGHLSLVDLARKNADRTIVSIFVNPTQFAPNEDFSAYPRTEAADAAKLEGKADLIFAPNAEDMYPEGFSTTISLTGVSEPLEGTFRPTHFAGVATVVAKLILRAMPDIAIFGEKDWQQLMVIRRMVADLDIPTKILGGPIVREPDGLALSSRNVYLSPEERKAAGQLNVILRETAASVANGAPISEATAKGGKRILALGFEKLDYLEVRDAASLAPFPNDRPTAPARILVAAKIGKTRLIDNMPV